MNWYRDDASDSDKEFVQHLQRLMEHEEPVPEELVERFAGVALQAQSPPTAVADDPSRIGVGKHGAPVLAASLAFTVVGHGLEAPMSLLMAVALAGLALAYAITVERLLRT